MAAFSAVRSSADQKTIVRSAGKGSPLLVVIVPTRELAEQAHAEVGLSLVLFEGYRAG